MTVLRHSALMEDCAAAQILSTPISYATFQKIAVPKFKFSLRAKSFLGPPLQASTHF